MSEREEEVVVKAVPKAPAAPAPVIKTVEEWATAKKMLPAVHAGGALGLPGVKPGIRSVPISMALSGQVAPRANPLFVGFRAAQVRNRWPIGHECTEAQFDEAVAKAHGPESEVICR